MTVLSLKPGTLALECETWISGRLNSRLTEVQQAQRKHDHCPNTVLEYGCGLFYSKT